MKIKQILTIILIILVPLALAACGGNTPANTGDVTQLSQEEQLAMMSTQVAQTMQAEIQLTIAAQPTATLTPQASPTPLLLPTNTPLPALGSPTPFPTLPALPTPTQIPTKPSTTTGRPCYRAELLWERPQDGQSYFPGDSFIKYWNFSNAGDCPWLSSFNLVHVGGPNLSDYESYNLVDISNMTEDGIPNGGKLEIQLSMQAPESPGRYKSLWLFRSDNNETFGVGGLGDEVFWVEILVRE